jgi:hypothetical protein
VEQELAAGLSERQVAELIEDDEVHPGQMFGDATLPSVAGLNLQAIDEVDYVVEAASGAGSDAASGNGDGQMGLAGAGPANLDGIALLALMETEVLGCRRRGVALRKEQETATTSTAANLTAQGYYA